MPAQALADPDTSDLRRLSSDSTALVTLGSGSMDDHVYETARARSAFHDRLPIGTSVSAQPLLESRFFGFEGDVRMVPLEPMLVPERPRAGEVDPAECFHCTRGYDEAIWRDDVWHVGHASSTGLPFLAGLAPNEVFSAR